LWWYPPGRWESGSKKDARTGPLSKKFVGEKEVEIPFCRVPRVRTFTRRPGEKHLSFIRIPGLVVKRGNG
jgi:hypothetical protein